MAAKTKTKRPKRTSKRKRSRMAAPFAVIDPSAVPIDRRGGVWHCIDWCRIAEAVRLGKAVHIQTAFVGGAGQMYQWKLSIALELGQQNVGLIEADDGLYIVPRHGIDGLVMELDVDG